MAGDKVSATRSYIRKPVVLKAFNYNYAVIQVLLGKMRLKEVPDEFRDETICTFALMNKGTDLQSVPFTLRSFSMCLLAVETDVTAYQYVPANIRCERDFNIAISEAETTIHMLNLSKIPICNRTRDICETAVKYNGLMLKCVPDYVKDGPLCQTAVTNNVWALAFVPVVSHLLTMSISKLAYDRYLILSIPEPLRTIEICSAVLLHDIASFAFMPDSFKSIENYAAICTIDKSILDDVPEGMRNDVAKAMGNVKLDKYKILQ